MINDKRQTDIPILYEDDQLIVVDKPAGIVVNRSKSAKGPTVHNWAEKKLKIKNEKLKIKDEDFYQRSGIVHRLDKETSGILLIAKTAKALFNLQDQFKKRTIKKKYLALVHGSLPAKEGTIKTPIARKPDERKKFSSLPEGREATTSYRLINSYYFHNQYYNLVEVTPLTGRTHQIRVHFKYLGFPIVADKLYAGRKRYRKDKRLFPRMFLHATEITFRHPKTNQSITVSNPLGKELETVLKKMTKKNV